MATTIKNCPVCGKPVDYDPYIAATFIAARAHIRKCDKKRRAS